MTRVLAIAFVLMFGAASLAAGDEGAVLDFTRVVRPILAEHCVRCHGPDEGTRAGGLRFDAADGAYAAGDSGEHGIVPGAPDESELVRRIFSDDDDERMPPDEAKTPLTEQQKQILVQWIKEGAAFDAHWAFSDIQRPEIPENAAREVPSASAGPESTAEESVIDRVVRAAWPAEVSVPPAADRYTLARRASLDLLGLPPELDEVDRFAADQRPDAWVRYVDRLLASPRYGERWAWPWLDAARYADSNGYQGDGDRTMWPWRDWVVDALNRDLPYDVWTEWQLAGDLLPEPTEEQRLATGFLRNHMINGEGGRIPEENRVEYVFDMTETTGTVWLALTFNCCRCHDHKFDPISRRDYFQMFAYFNRTPVDGSGGDPRTPPNMPAPTDEQRRQLAALESDRIASLTLLEEIEAKKAEVKKAEAEAAAREAAGQSEPAAAASPTIAPRDRTREQWRALIEQPDTTAEHRRAIERHLKVLERIDNVQSSIPVVMVMADVPEPRPTYMLSKGAYDQREGEVTAGVPQVIAAWDESWPQNRLGLAKWLLDESQPLTARVAVNRVWQELFGIGLVKTSEDFGTQGEPPANEPLLSLLATSYREQGWSSKQLVRSILLSSTYRANAGRVGSENELDPANRLMARGARYRLPSWMLRDQALAISGMLSNRIGGPPVHPYQPDGVWQEATFGARGYPQSHGEDLHRRSMYTFWRRIIAPTMFFDGGSRQTCTVTISRTNTPLHSLATLNDVTYVEAARITADEVLVEAGEVESRVWLEQLFRRVLVRPPQPEELEVLIGAFERHRQRYEGDQAAAQSLLSFGEAAAPAVANSLPISTRAAATAVASTLLNLDETLSKE